MSDNLRTVDLNDKSQPHWTDSHIKYDEGDRVYVSYDEVGLEHGRYEDCNSARDALVVYDKNKSRIKNEKSPFRGAFSVYDY